MQENQKKKKNQLNSYVRFSSLTFQMTLIILAGTFFGDFLDTAAQSESSIYTIIFSLSSIFLALYYVFKKVISNNEKD